MAYKRKTKDVYEIQGFYAGEWETVTEEETWKEAKVQLKCYNENERMYPHRIKKRRERIEVQASA